MGKKKDHKKSSKRASEGLVAESEAESAATTPTAAKKAKAPGISTDDIALRAYFISEKRRSQGLHGSEHEDWVEAERQLVAEKKKPKKKSVPAI